MMRTTLYTLSLAFAVGALAPLSAMAGEGCSFGSHAKKNDLEPPPPASATTVKRES